MATGPDRADAALEGMAWSPAPTTAATWPGGRSGRRSTSAFEHTPEDRRAIARAC